MSSSDTVGQLSHLRRALGSFLTGVTVVTTVDDAGRPRGFTANSFTSVSLDPPLVLVCIAETAASAEAFRNSAFIGITILNEDQRDVAIKFASKDSDKFESIDCKFSVNGVPLVNDALAWIECRAHAVVPMGDHFILVGRVVDLCVGEARPLGFFRGNFIDFNLVDEAIEYAHRGDLAIGCIVESAGQLLLCRRRPQDPWTLPMGSLSPGGGSPTAALQRLLKQLGADVEVNFLFSVFYDNARSSMNIIHRGRLRGPLAVDRDQSLQGHLFSPDDLPWDGLSIPVTNMLRRYLQERRAGHFAIYTEYDDNQLLAKLGGQAVTWRPEHEPAW